MSQSPLVDLPGLDKRAQKDRFRRTFWVEIIGLCLAAIAFMLPLRFVLLNSANSRLFVDLYYLASMIIFLGAEYAYLWPIRRLVIFSKVAFGVGHLLLFGVLVFWLSRVHGRVIDLSNLETGRIIGPIIIGLALPAIQGFTIFASTDHNRS